MNPSIAESLSFNEEFIEALNQEKYKLVVEDDKSLVALIELARKTGIVEFARIVANKDLIPQDYIKFYVSYLTMSASSCSIFC